MLSSIGKGARLYWLLSAAVFAVGVVVFLFIGFHQGTDIYLHALYLVDCIENRLIPAAFLYFLVLGLVTLFTTNVKTIVVGSALILAASLAARYQISTGAANHWLGAEAAAASRRRWVLISCLGLLVVFCLPLPGEYWMAGQFPPNLWHNATHIFLMPFAVLLFFHSYEYLEAPRRHSIGILVLLVVVNILIKPSFFLCFAPVFPLFALARFGLRRPLFQACIPVAAGAGVLALQYLHIYYNPYYDRVTEAGGAAIAFGWFHPWREWANSVPLSIVNSLLLPLLFCLVYPRAFFSDRRIRFALILLAVGMGLFAFVYETGSRELHGNFGWQMTICNYLLHLVVLVAFLRLKFDDPDLGWRDYLLIGVFQLEVILGIAYVAKVMLSGAYL